MLVSEFLTAIKSDLKLEDGFVVDDIALDPSITQADLLRYINESLSEAAYMIMHSYEDYFLKSETKSLVAGQRRYALPADIMLEKIRRVFVHDNADIFETTVSYKVEPIYRLDDTLNYAGVTDVYPSKYMILNNMPVTDIALSSYPVAINFFPMPSTANTYYTIDYIRMPFTVTNVTDKIDFEFVDFLKEDVKERIVRYKDIGNPMTAEIKAKRAELKDLMFISLANKIPDDTNEMNQLNRGAFNNAYGSSLVMGSY